MNEPITIGSFIINYCLKDGRDLRDIAYRMSDDMSEFSHNLTLIVELTTYEFLQGKKYLRIRGKTIAKLAEAIEVPLYIIKRLADAFDYDWRQKQGKVKGE